MTRKNITLPPQRPMLRDRNGYIYNTIFVLITQTDVITYLWLQLGLRLSIIMIVIRCSIAYFIIIWCHSAFPSNNDTLVTFCMYSPAQMKIIHIVRNSILILSTDELYVGRRGIQCFLLAIK